MSSKKEHEQHWMDECLERATNSIASTPRSFRVDYDVKRKEKPYMLRKVIVEHLKEVLYAARELDYKLLTIEVERLIKEYPETYRPIRYVDFPEA